VKPTAFAADTQTIETIADAPRSIPLAHDATERGERSETGNRTHGGVVMWRWTKTRPASSLLCLECRQEIAAYDAVIVETEGLRWRTTLARNPTLQATDLVTHAGCAPAQRHSARLTKTASRLAWR
jgi:hypothetical protein